MSNEPYVRYRCLVCRKPVASEDEAAKCADTHGNCFSYDDHQWVALGEENRECQHCGEIEGLNDEDEWAFTGRAW